MEQEPTCLQRKRVFQWPIMAEYRRFIGTRRADAEADRIGFPPWRPQAPAP